jgi:hypothetical protein
MQNLLKHFDFIARTPLQRTFLPGGTKGEETKSNLKVFVVLFVFSV